MNTKTKLRDKCKKNMIFIAVGVFLITILIFYTDKKMLKPKENLGTLDDPKEALIETHKALQLLSNSMNEGLQQASYLEEYEKTKK